MKAPLIVVTGTGTEIGKTHVAGALLLAWARVLAEAGMGDATVVGLKPVESGVTGGAVRTARYLNGCPRFT